LTAVRFYCTCSWLFFWCDQEYSGCKFSSRFTGCSHCTRRTDRRVHVRAQRELCDYLGLCARISTAPHRSLWTGLNPL